MLHIHDFLFTALCGGRTAAVHNSVLRKPHLLSIRQVNIGCQSHNLWIRLSYKATAFGPQIRNEKQELSLTGSSASRVWIHLCLADLIGYSLLTGDAEGGADGGWAETSTRADPQAARLLSQVENVFSDLCLTCCPVGLGFCVCVWLCVCTSGR